MIEINALQQRLAANQVIPISYAGSKLLLDASGAIIWPAHKAIIFSDLHLEKGSFLSQFANPLPRFDSSDTIKRMQACNDIYQCEHIICLGDSLHDGNAVKRMQKTDLATLNKLVESVARFTWILGNHDPQIPDEIKGERLPFLVLSQLLLAHEPEELTLFTHAKKIRGQVIGHYHPKSTHKLANKRVTGKCFVACESMLVMPAFGKYTGGLDTKDDAFKGILGEQDTSTYLLFNQKIFFL